jgi:hypothetical protein
MLNALSLPSNKHVDASQKFLASKSFTIVLLAVIMKSYFALALASAFAGQVLAGDDKWLSPVYKEIFQNELPIPPTKEKKYTYFNSTTNTYIDYYEVEIKAFEQQVYKGAGFKPAQLVGYGKFDRPMQEFERSTYVFKMVSRRVPLSAWRRTVKL